MIDTKNLIDSIHDDILVDLRKSKAIFDNETDMFEYREIIPTFSSEIIQDIEKPLIIKEEWVYGFKYQQIDIYAEKAISIYKAINQINEKGLTLANIDSSNLNQLEDKKLKKIYNDFYLKSNNNDRLSTYIDRSIKRLIRFTEKNVPDILLEKELSILTSRLLKKDFVIKVNVLDQEMEWINSKKDNDELELD